MAITITQERTKQRKLVLILSFMIFSILSVVLWGRSRGEQAPSAPASQPIIYAFPEIDIDWKLLDNIRGQSLQPFEEISEFEGKFGRQNPFIPY